MNKMSSAEIRQKFLDFFAQKDHEIKPSASLIPVNDPTLLWINSGVATLKRYFDGSEVPNNPRITNSQKSIRTNDIENVGVTARHHTLFEMLGNFSIGDYHKQEAIEYAWEFLTDSDWLGFDPEKLFVTYYPEDTETRDIWLKIDGFNSEHLIAEEDNFWDIGAGPCGPNTEIFYDRGPEYLDIDENDPENYPGGENERWLEIWNLVFSELNHMADDTYEPLPNKNIDTGMGLERLVSIIQDTPTNFETDLFMPIIQKIEDLSQIQYEDSEDLQVSFKVIADHTRAVVFAISDGALPSNEGRGYIIRRLIRRTIMHARRLGITTKFLSDLVPVVVEVMGDYYHELNDRIDFVQQVLSQEEDRFHETLEAGESLLNNIIEKLSQNDETVIPGEVAFKLYDTYGFPLELTQEEANRHHFEVDEEGFQAEMEKQRERARGARSNESSMQSQSETLLQITTPYEFIGYDSLMANGTIQEIVFEDQLVNQLKTGQQGWVFFNRAPFYAESGGQTADHGAIFDGNDEVGVVLDVQKAPNGQAMHLIEVVGDIGLQKNQSYTLVVDRQRRILTKLNHSATHLLHQALKSVLGEHVQQAGSYVGPDRLRFDFTHFSKLSEEELQQVEDEVNQWIYQHTDVMISEMSQQEAESLGATALFGEKYGDIVRVVNIGNYSLELCGGTHVNNTSEIGTFKIISESGIGAGVRRIEAFTGEAAVNYYQEQLDILNQTMDLLRVKQPDGVVGRIEQLQTNLKEAQNEVQTLKTRQMQQSAEDLFNDVQEVQDLTYVAVSLENQETDNMRQLGDMWRDKQHSNLLVVISDQGDSVSLLVFADEQAIDKGVRAGDLIKELAKSIGGGGGGRPEMAQAGGKNPAGIPTLLEEIPQRIEELIKDN